MNQSRSIKSDRQIGINMSEVVIGKSFVRVAEALHEGVDELR